MAFQHVFVISFCFSGLVAAGQDAPVAPEDVVDDSKKKLDKAFLAMANSKSTLAADNAHTHRHTSNELQVAAARPHLNGGSDTDTHPKLVKLWQKMVHHGKPTSFNQVDESLAEKGFQQPAEETQAGEALTDKAQDSSDPRSLLASRVPRRSDVVAQLKRAVQNGDWDYVQQAASFLRQQDSTKKPRGSTLAELQAITEDDAGALQKFIEDSATQDGADLDLGEWTDQFRIMDTSKDYQVDAGEFYEWTKGR